MTVFVNWAFRATGGTTARTLPDRLADIVNVKDYGAAGDGTTDDTASIQAAFDAAFGSSDSPHGIAGSSSNRIAWFPCGNYKISSTLTLTDVYGGQICGSGRESTAITQSVANANGMTIDGANQCSFQDFSIKGVSGTGIAIDLDWGGSGSVGLSNNLFKNLLMEGGTASGGRGVRVAHSGNQGSNNAFVMCQPSGDIAYLIEGSSAFNQYVVGGGIGTNNTGIRVTGGSIQTYGLSLAISGTVDIDISSSYPSFIVGSRTESSHFFLGSSCHVSVLACQHKIHTTGRFLDLTGGAKVTTDCCDSDGLIYGSTAPTLYIRGCVYANANILTNYTGTIAQNI